MPGWHAPASSAAPLLRRRPHRAAPGLLHQFERRHHAGNAGGSGAGLGIGTPVASATIPLGTTINMDGSGLYVAAVAVFAAQLFGLSLSPSDYGIILLTRTLVSIGAASVPSASLFLLAVVLEAIGITP